MTATKYKKKPKEANRSDDVEIETPTQAYPKLKREAYEGYVYENPVKILICFEVNDHIRGHKLMNKDGVTFTRVVNDALRAHLKKNKIA